MACFQNNSLIAAKMLIDVFSKKHNDEFNLFLAPLERIALVRMCMNIKSLMKWNFDFEQFYDILSEVPNLKIEVFWTLHVLSIFPFDTYLIKLKSPNILNLLKRNLCSLFLMDIEGDAPEFFQMSILSHFIRKTFNGTGEEIEKVYASVIRDFLEELFSSRKEDISTGRMKTLYSLWKCGLIEIDAFHEFCVSALYQFVKEPYSTVMEAYDLQENFISTAYKLWLAQFENCLLIKNPEVFTFLIDTLSTLVPYEKNVAILKVGLEKPFSVPSSCQSIYNDYIVLLKTRINDLEPQVQPEDLINKLLLMYQDTGRIPSYVMEASLMRKHYFVNEFLPVLLSPRIIPAIPDIRERFIDELHRIGKIPNVILQKYKTLCSQEKQKLLKN
ncbi:fanconi anemia group A protein [Caerostris extrusa]|uniref:Fanconi anemia group A protein n=1 Tax=Caerostris extrusa TaxID=172846 RepID=A0AAV4Q484_CAEEX|nr:fanconi anemia group A protein [Caerostris extrusa]